MTKKPIEIVGRRLFWGCHVCLHPVSGMTGESIQAAMDAHAEYVNLTMDREQDEHFAEVRLDQLVIA